MRVLCVCCGLLVLALASFAQPVIFPALTSTPLRGVVTLVEPNGQFYTNLGSKDQLFRNATIRILRGGVMIAHARVIHVDRLDSIANLDAPYRGLLLQAGDMVIVDTNPVPQQPPASLPAIEPSYDFRDEDALFTLLILIGIGSAINNP